MPIYTVKPGDTLSTIAQRHGICSWQNLYNDPSNASYRAKRPNPDRIFPGDQIHIPTFGPTNDYKMAIIDGTGPSDDNVYFPAMRNSFCKQLGEQLGAHAEWKRGPGPLGWEVEAEAKVAYDYLKEAHHIAMNNGTTVKLMLAGYSRGGSAAIMAAEKLRKDHINVDSLFLFDAVARRIGEGGEVIPDNVQFSRHARRNLNAFLMVLKYEGSFSEFSEIPGYPNTSNPMRPTFGNTGLTWPREGNHQARQFIGSHGALGGVGWKFVKEDEACQNQVAAWMNAQLHERGVSANLRSLSMSDNRDREIPTATAWITGVALDALLIAKHNWNLKRAGRVQ